MWAVTVQAHYDDSNIMADYFNQHAAIGGKYVLAVVPAGSKRTEALHRTIINNTMLSAYSWTWHTEEYSGGNGTYLKSGVIGVCQQHTYAGADTAPVWLEVEIDKYAKKGTKSQHFVESLPASVSGTTTGSDGVRLSVNHAKNGVQVHFPGIPAESVRAALKTAGFRWSKFNKCWYNDDTPRNRAAAEAITELKFPETGGSSRDHGGDMLDAANEQAADTWAYNNL
jgi:hypothetical protein